MRNKVFAFFLLLLITANTQSQTTDFSGGNICNTEEWQLVFNDEFDGDSLDKSKWVTYFPNTPTGNDQCEFCRTHGDEDQIYLDNNVIQNNGTLKLLAKRQTSTWFTAVRDYTSGLIQSREGFMYGKFEISCKIPLGKGMFPAFWMFGGNGTEIDVFEFCGQTPDRHHLGIAKWDFRTKIASEDYGYNGTDFSTSFHVFSAEWDAFFISFKVDDNEVYKIARLYTNTGEKINRCCVGSDVYVYNPAFPSGVDNKVNVIVNLAIGSVCQDPDNNTVLPNQFEIDYLRVYQRDPINNTLGTCFISLFPNPVHNNLFISHEKMKFIRIVNIFGEEVYSLQVNSDEIEIDINSLPIGFYLIKVESEYGVQAAKFIKVEY